MNQEMSQVLNQVSRPDFSALYSRMFKIGMHRTNATLAMHVIMAECDGFMSQRLLPQRAESRQFSYISEDDGAAHTTRRIDWTYIFS